LVIIVLNESPRFALNAFLRRRAGIAPTGVSGSGGASVTGRAPAMQPTEVHQTQ
jgi:hypothetical protein